MTIPRKAADGRGLPLFRGAVQPAIIAIVAGTRHSVGGIGNSLSAPAWLRDSPGLMAVHTAGA